MDGPEDDTVEVPAFLSANTRRADHLYRELERGSEFRAQKAAEDLGVSVSEMSHLKITDLNDARHPGDVAAKMTPPPLAAEMRQFANQGAPVGFMNGQQMMGGMASEEVCSGPYPNFGHNFIESVLRPGHLERVDPRQLSSVQSDRPALETTNPGYRRRSWR